MSVEEYFANSLRELENEAILHYLNSEVFTEVSQNLNPIPHTFFMRDELYSKVSECLKDPINDRKFKALVGKYIDNNHTKLHTIGPLYQIVFYNEKKDFFNCFSTSEKEINAIASKVIAKIPSNSKFKYLTNNPIFWLFYCVIRYYYLKNDTQGLNTALIIYAIAVYPSVYKLVFPHQPNPGIMQYTIEHLSERFIIKQQGDLFGMLYSSINRSFEYHKQFMETFTDGQIISFIERIHNDQKSLLKNIMDAYMKNYRAGLRTSVNLDSNMNNLIGNEVTTDSSVVDTVTERVVVPILSSGVNLKIVAQARAIGNISLADTRFYISKVLNDDHADEIKSFIQAIITCFLYEDHYSISDINTKNFLIWSMNLFRKTNSKNENIRTIKTLLDKWGDDTGIHAKFKHVATIINYKKAIFFYFILSIQNYNS